MSTPNKVPRETSINFNSQEGTAGAPSEDEASPPAAFVSSEGGTTTTVRPSNVLPATSTSQLEPVSETVESTAAEPRAEPTSKTVTPPVIPAEWTQLACDNAPVIRYPTDVAGPEVWDASETDTIMLVGTSGQKITHLSPDFGTLLHPQLKRLVLRSHLIAVMQGLQSLQTLELLELYDNQIEALQGLDTVPFATTLRTLDISYNVIRDMAPVQYCPNLQELYLANNKLKTIDGLEGLKQLRKLDLGANRIRSLPGTQLAGLTQLEELWLGKNKIDSLEGLKSLTTRNLRRLDVQSNRLTEIQDGCLPEHVQATLEEWYMADNGIDTEGLAGLTVMRLVKLNVLDLSKNRLTDCRPLAAFTSLEELWLSGNRVESWDQVDSLTALVHLETIYLEYNPLAQSDPLYRKHLAEIFADNGALRQIDADPIGPAGRAGGGAALDRQAELQRLQAQVVARARQETREFQEATSSS